MVAIVFFGGTSAAVDSIQFQAGGQAVFSSGFLEATSLVGHFAKVYLVISAVDMAGKLQKKKIVI
jgi:hypothetical protein